MFLFACPDGDEKTSHPDATVRIQTKDAEVKDAELLDLGLADADGPDAGFSSDIGFWVDAGANVYETIVLLDGVPAADTPVLQGGTENILRTDENGRVFVAIDWSLEGDIWILASHPRARIWGATVDPDDIPPVIIDLEAYDDSDNLQYPFSDPGEPGRRPSTAECGHCHQTINDSWFASPHRKTASNPHLHDLYRGSAHAIVDAQACADAGGRWVSGQLPGSTQNGFQCYLDDSVLSALNASCETPPCSSGLTQFGACADCHAPGINGRLGGRDLKDATEVAYNYGVHCDVCHHVEEVLLSEAPGVAGRLKLLRPSEEASRALGGGGFLPMTFGPSPDSPNPRMGSVQRDHFRKATICAGCHEHEQEVLVLGQSIDWARWPSGKLPIQTTYGEWLAGPFSPGAPCQSCHMPPDPLVANGGDLQRYPFAIIGLQGGYPRPPGSVRQHSWVGPRTPSSNMLQLAAAIFIQKSVYQNTVTATVTVKNVGCGHGLPTGEPMRSVLLTVEAYCGTQSEHPLGGDVIPDFGGWSARKSASEDWSQWPEAEVGDVVRVIRRSGDFYDYRGYGAFDQRFTSQEKGLRVESYVGSATITAVHSSSVSFSWALPSGDIAYRVKPDGYAGRPGFGFARVTADASGNTMVPHYLATDVVSDNRLMPQAAWSSTHRFEASCANPIIRAKLIHRPYSPAVAKARNWTQVDTLMVETKR